VRERLPGGVTDDIAAGDLVGGPGRGEAALGFGHHGSQCLTIAKAPHRAAAPISAASNVSVNSRQLMASGDRSRLTELIQPVAVRRHGHWSDGLPQPSVTHLRRPHGAFPRFRAMAPVSGPFVFGDHVYPTGIATHAVHDVFQPRIATSQCGASLTPTTAAR
jgi:hypothetical protein